MAAVIQELVTKFGFTGSIKPLTSYNQNLVGSIKLLGGMTLALQAGAAAFAYWAGNQLSAVDSLGAVAKHTRIAASTIQELNYAAEQNQSTSAAMEGSLQALTKTIGSAALKGSEEFARLGISIRDSSGQVKTADKVLDDVRRRFVQMGLSIGEQETFASALGIDSSLLQLLNRTDSEMAGLRDRARELGTLNNEQIEQAEKYKKSLSSMQFALSSVRQLIAVGVAPDLTRMADAFTKLLVENKDWIINGVQFAVRWIGNFLEAVNRLWPILVGGVAIFLALKVAAIGFGTVMGIIFSPVVLITAAIVAFLVIIDDLIVGFQGGRSEVNEFFKEFLGIDLIAALKSQFEWMMGWINRIIEGWKIVYDWIAGTDDAAEKIPTEIPAGTAAAGTGGATTDNRQVNQSNTVNVYTNDAQAAGRAVGDSLQAQLENANTQLAVGGR